VSVGASSYDFTRGLMPERQWYGDAAVLQRQLATEAKVVAAFPNVQIAVAYPSRSDAEQHLRSGWFRRGGLKELERLSEVDHSIASHKSVSSCVS